METLILMVALALQIEARADDGGVVQLVQGPAYERLEDFEFQGLTVRGFRIRDAAATKGSSYYLVREANAAGWTYAYRIDRIGRTGTRLDVHLLAADADPETADATRVASRQESTARTLVEQAVRATASWSDHKRFLRAAYAKDPATAHAGWRRVVRSLERAHDEHPGHLGILRDLIVAYTKLNAFEQGTVTAANLCRLLPARIAEYKAGVGGLSADEQLTFTRARALLLFECGLYPLADALVAEANDPQLVSLRRSMTALGQTDFSEKDAFTVRGELAAYAIRVIETGGNPPSGRLLHDEFYFLTRLVGTEAAVGHVWYTLSRQTLDGSARYYLYGRSGESRSLLMMYGTQRPAYEVVRADVERAMAAALAAPNASRARARSGDSLKEVMKIALAAALVLAGLAFVLHRRRKRRR